MSSFFKAWLFLSFVSVFVLATNSRWPEPPSDDHPVIAYFEFPKHYDIKNATSYSTWGATLDYTPGSGHAVTKVTDFDGDYYFEVHPTPGSPEYCVIDSGVNMSTVRDNLITILDQVGPINCTITPDLTKHVPVFKVSTNVSAPASPKPIVLHPRPVSVKNPLTAFIEFPSSYDIQNATCCANWMGSVDYTRGTGQLVTTITDIDGDVYFEVRLSAGSPDFCVIDSGANLNTGVSYVRVRTHTDKIRCSVKQVEGSRRHKHKFLVHLETIH